MEAARILPDSDENDENINDEFVSDEHRSDMSGKASSSEYMRETWPSRVRYAFAGSRQRGKFASKFLSHYEIVRFNNSSRVCSHKLSLTRSLIHHVFCS